MQADREAVARRAPDEVRVQQRKALLVEPGMRNLELLALAAVGQGRVEIQPSAGDRRVVVERCRSASISACSGSCGSRRRRPRSPEWPARGRGYTTRQELEIFGVEIAERSGEVQPIARASRDPRPARQLVSSSTPRKRALPALVVIPTEGRHAAEQSRRRPSRGPARPCSRPGTRRAPSCSRRSNSRALPAELHSCRPFPDRTP